MGPGFISDFGFGGGGGIRWVGGLVGEDGDLGAWDGDGVVMIMVVYYSRFVVGGWGLVISGIVRNSASNLGIEYQEGTRYQTLPCAMIGWL